MADRRPIIDRIGELYESVALSGRTEMTTARRALGGALIRVDRKLWTRHHSRVYRRLHRDSVLAYQREWQKSHPRQAKPYDPVSAAKYRESHREERRASDRDRPRRDRADYCKQRYAADPEKMRRWFRDYYAANRGELNARRRELYAAAKTERLHARPTVPVSVPVQDTDSADPERENG